jgi:hypothetical protein
MASWPMPRSPNKKSQVNLKSSTVYGTDTRQKKKYQYIEEKALTLHNKLNYVTGFPVFTMRGAKYSAEQYYTI